LVSLDYRGAEESKSTDYIGKFLEGTYSTIAVLQYEPLPRGVVETEEVLRLPSGITVSRTYRVRAETQIDLSQEGLTVLPVLYYPDIVCGHAHANDQYTEKTYHSHWQG
jgi:hypothetical protein